MTGRLHMRVEQDLGRDVAQGAVASVTPLGATYDEASRKQGIVIPAGGADPAVLEVAAGKYFVEALLPSGEVVTTEVEVADDDDVAVELHGYESKHEWLSWQRLVGNVPSSAQGPPDQEAEATDSGKTRPKVTWVSDPVAALRGNAPGDAWEVVGAMVGQKSLVKRLTSEKATKLRPASKDDAVMLYHVAADGAAAPSGAPSGSRDPLPRRYLLAEGEDWAELVCAPVPWIAVKSREQAVVEVLVRVAPEPGVAGTALSVRDPDLGAAVGYLSIGALAAARQLVDTAKEMLFGKAENPLGAAAGGYILLGTDSGEDDRSWHEWIATLRARFPWLPDGAIQHAWLRLRHRTSTADVDDARQALVEAYERGLPFYSIGLQWLVDSLTLFAEEPEMAGRLKRVQAVVWRANLQQPFTTLRLRPE